MTEWTLRHGRGLNNDEGLLIGDPIDGVGGYGLTELGRIQARQSAQEAKTQGLLGTERPIVYIVSPFDRAFETALEYQAVLGGFIVIDERLSERSFGEYERTSDRNLRPFIWPEDEKSEHNTTGGVETPFSVGERISAARRDAQEAFPDHNIIYVSHGDPLQIMHFLAMGDNTYHVGHHRRVVQGFRNAELRRLP